MSAEAPVGPVGTVSIAPAPAPGEGLSVERGMPVMDVTVFGSLTETAEGPETASQVIGFLGDYFAIHDELSHIFQQRGENIGPKQTFAEADVRQAIDNFTASQEDPSQQALREARAHATLLGLLQLHEENQEGAESILNEARNVWNELQLQHLTDGEAFQEMQDFFTQQELPIDQLQQIVAQGMETNDADDSEIEDGNEPPEKEDDEEDEKPDKSDDEEEKEKEKEEERPVIVYVEDTNTQKRRFEVAQSLEADESGGPGYTRRIAAILSMPVAPLAQGRLLSRGTAAIVEADILSGVSAPLAIRRTPAVAAIVTVSSKASTTNQVSAAAIIAETGSSPQSVAEPNRRRRGVSMTSSGVQAA